MKETCTECNKEIEKENMVVFGRTKVCSGCKHIYVQKLREGVLNNRIPKFFRDRAICPNCRSHITRFRSLKKQLQCSSCTANLQQNRVWCFVGSVCSAILFGIPGAVALVELLKTGINDKVIIYFSVALFTVLLTWLLLPYITVFELVVNEEAREQETDPASPDT